MARYRLWWVSGKDGDPPETRQFQQVEIIGFMALQELVWAMTGAGMKPSYKKLDTSEV